MGGLRRSVWITEPNVIRLKGISRVLKLDNDNKVINAVIEDYANYLANKRAVELFKLLIEEMKK